MAKERIVFVHGAGRFGAAAWPNQHKLALEYDCLFMKRPGGDGSFAADAEALAELLGEGGHVVAHHDGAVPAMLAAVAHPDTVRSLTLFEPACLSLTRDLPATERYVAAHAGEASPVWEAPLHIVPGVPTLVVTGAWEPLYEEIAGYLATTGAVHVHAAGDHRPQDSAQGHQALVDFIRAHSL